MDEVEAESINPDLRLGIDESESPCHEARLGASQVRRAKCDVVKATAPSVEIGQHPGRGQHELNFTPAITPKEYVRHPVFFQVIPARFPKPEACRKALHSFLLPDHDSHMVKT